MVASDNGRKCSIIGWIAIVGILMGALGLLVLTVGEANRQKMVRMRCLNNLRQIGLGIKMYAVDNNEAYPEAGSDLVAPHFRLLSNAVGNTGQIFICPEDPAKRTPCLAASGMTDANISYCYVRGLNDSVAIDHPLAFDSNFAEQGPSPDGKPLRDFCARIWTSGHRDAHETRFLGFTVAMRETGKTGGFVLFAGAHVMFVTEFPMCPPLEGWTNIVEVP